MSNIAPARTPMRYLMKNLNTNYLKIKNKFRKKLSRVNNNIN